MQDIANGVLFPASDASSYMTGAELVIDGGMTVLACGYSGPLSLEVFNDEFRAAPARLTARDGLRSLILAEAEAGGRELPDPPVFDGVEFVEFAVDEVSGDISPSFSDISGSGASGGIARRQSVCFGRDGSIYC